ncbi:MAG: 1-acyl-sn-glycerol-3-phosphate acyltransferase [Firmicutes bacterium]|nr:1-acyl-sn-glycerol-3-phosphate acyltransferase [Bacillota bacterium]
MKIKVKEKSYDKVMAMAPFKNRRPEPQGAIWRKIIKIAAAKDIKKVSFELRRIGMESLGGEPCLYLMNHSSFIDLEIAGTIIYPCPYHIVCTLDGFVGKEWLMRKIGCIPTRKFMLDTSLVRDLIYTAKELRESILLYPEASYTFDGTATPLPESIGKLVKMLDIPVVMIRTYGAFARDPLYNGLQIRDVKVSADMKYLLSREDIEEKSVAEINDILAGEFTFDNFAWQKEEGVVIDEPFRADYLERVLYKCPCCMTEGEMEGKGTVLRCKSCGAAFELTELGDLRPIELDLVAATKTADLIGKQFDEVFSSVPNWYAWERAEVRQEIEDGTYRMEFPVDIIALVNTDAVYRIGEGVLTHDVSGFHLAGCGGALDYRQEPSASYSLYSDYFWYELGDMISIGTPRIQYYCFPKTVGANVAKARLATEELYKLRK